MILKKSDGLTDTERILAELAEKSFLNIWSYPNPYRDDGDELCDLIVVYEDTVILFFDRHSNILVEGTSDPETLWKRWKRKVVDKQIKTARGAERYLRTGRLLFLDPRQETKFPLPIDINKLEVFKIIIAHGASEVCKLASIQNMSGSLAIAYTQVPTNIDNRFAVELEKDDPIHILDSENLEIVFSELDTIYDFVAYLREKERVISELDILSYCAEEDLVAYYFRNFNQRKNDHYIKTTRRKSQPLNGLHIDQGFWSSFSKNLSYLRKKEADKISYFWDSLIQKTGQNILNDRAEGNDNVFLGQSAIHEMAKETRFARRQLSERFLSAVDKFPTPTAGSLLRYITFVESFDKRKGYLLLQLFVHPEKQGDYEKEYTPKRRAILEIACGSAKNKFPHLNKIIGIAVDAPKFSPHLSEDFMLLNCDNWSDEDIQYYDEMNKNWNFFKTGKEETGKQKVSQFPLKPGRNDPCYCGSGKKYKKCHGVHSAN